LTETQDAHTTGPSTFPEAAPLEFRDVTKVYPGSDQPAVDHLSLEVPAGEVCVLVGPSGSGKTTAMKMVNRLISITEGDILIAGRGVRGMDLTELRRGIGYVIQQVGLFPHMTLEDNIGTVPRLVGWDKHRIKQRARELLELVGLDPERDARRYPSQLSGGQRQRVGVARAMAVDPPLMLMDEPFGAIDPITRTRLQDEFLRLQERIGKTVVFVTHDIDEAIKMGDRIAILREGGVLAQYDTPSELLLNPVDDFVARFVGQDRALKRLTLTQLRDIDLGAVPAEPNGRPPISIDSSLHDALSVMLAAGEHEVLVTDGDQPRGIASLDVITGVLKAPAAHAPPKPSGADRK
jgi:osmoprotectant transport system ATP-binding protein